MEKDKARVSSYVFLPTFGAQTTYDCQKDQQDETDIRKCSMVLTFNNCVDCLCYKERQIKAVQVFFKFSGMASKENKKVFILDF